MNDNSYFSQYSGEVRQQTTAPPVKKNASSSAPGALSYLIWSVEIFVAAVAILLGTLVCSFCRYEPQEETDILNQNLEFGEFEFAQYEQAPENLFSQESNS